MKRIIFFLSLAFLAVSFQSCVNAEKLVETGQFDEALALAQRKLSGKQRKNPKLVRAAEEAFAKVTARNVREIERLQRANRADNWGRINELTRLIRRRQEALRPLLPLTDKNGYTADFRFVNFDGLEEESRDKAAAYHYDEASRLLQLAENGDKAAARAAYRELDETLRYFRSYRNAEELQTYAHNLGTTHILLRVENNAPVVLPAGFDRVLRDVSNNGMDNFWQRYHTTNSGQRDFDYEIKFRITDIAVGPEVVREREYTDSREIEDGFEYVLDERGNVLKDSLGNDVKVPRYVTVNAWVLETLQQKEAQVRGTVEVHNTRTRRVLRSEPLTAATVFENYASTFRGDERALSNETRRRIGNRPIPFPSNEAMILQAADELKPALLNRITDYNYLVEI